VTIEIYKTEEVAEYNHGKLKVWRMTATGVAAKKISFDCIYIVPIEILAARISMTVPLKIKQKNPVNDIQWGRDTLNTFKSCFIFVLTSTF
jgi:hypothetical protein